MQRAKFFSDRSKSALGLGLIFMVIVSAVYIVQTDVTTILGVIIGARSPIYLWRFSHCMALDMYRDPTWLFNLEAAIPFFFYGAAIGYFLRQPPQLNIRYTTTTVVSLAATVAVLLCIPISDTPDPAC
jgi:hypothetical protein